MTEKTQTKKTRVSKYAEHKKSCLPLLIKGHTVKEIQEFLKLPNSRIIYNWIESEGWNEFITESVDAEFTASQRLVFLIGKEKKTNAEINEMETISRVLLNLAKTKAVGEGKSIHGNPKSPARSNNKKKKKKNDVSHLSQADFDRVAKKILYWHQKKWRKAGKDERTKYDRLILKSRQIGATYYFAFEAFESAVCDGENQIFLSATREQAEIFKAYMYAIAKEYFDVELSGNPITLDRGDNTSAMCYFLSSNSTGAQSRSGNVYFDEMFWVRDWDKMFDLGAAMATQGYKITGFSTPSALSHPAIKNWNGKRYNQERPKSEQVKISLKRADLKQGTKGGDGIWRNLVTVEDAVEHGFDRIDIELIKRRNPPSVYKNLYQCHFVNDSNSVFKLPEILACAVDPIIWKGYKPEDDHPWGRKPCTAGLDPAGVGDNACAVVMSKPDGLKDKFRLFESTMLDGLTASEQGEFINDQNDKYNLQYCGVNTNGLGYFVPDFIDQGIDVERLDYTPQLKQKFITKTKEVFKKKRFEYPENNKTIPLAFLTIVQTLTEKTRQITYVSNRSDEVGHGDEAWSIMGAFQCEDIDIGHAEISSLSISH